MGGVPVVTTVGCWLPRPIIIMSSSISLVPMPPLRFFARSLSELRMPFSASSVASSAPVEDDEDDVPADRVRLHVCWGNYEGPHDLDVPLEEIWPEVRKARVGGVLLSMANPRHEHEWRVFEDGSLPPGWLLLSGVIDTTSNYVEHPRTIADRIERVARVIGDPTRVLAGTDCGFETSSGLGTVASDVVWQKLRSLTQGAALASQRLYGGSVMGAR